jgi:hypothetical protein
LKRPPANGISECCMGTTSEPLILGVLANSAVAGRRESAE